MLISMETAVAASVTAELATWEHLAHEPQGIHIIGIY